MLQMLVNCCGGLSARLRPGVRRVPKLLYFYSYVVTCPISIGCVFHIPQLECLGSSLCFLDVNDRF
jgi:hypothetical protein